MTIATTTNRVDAPGNGSATSFSFAPVVIFAASNLQVTLRDSAGQETLLTQGAGSANYSVSVTTYPGTGAITYPASGGTPLPVGSTIVIKRIVPLLQNVSLSNQGAYFPKIQEGEYDYLTAIDQQQQEQLNRSLQLGSTDPSVPLTLPTIPKRAGMFLAFDGGGLPIAVPNLPAPVSLASSVVNVLSFGAKCDGVTDDTLAVQAAISSLPNGGTVWFPPGVCKTTATLFIRANGITLTGSGKAATTIKIASASATVISVNGFLTGTSIRDMTIDRSVTAVTGGNGIEDIVSCSFAKYADLFVQNHSVGMALGPTDFSLVSNVSSRFNALQGFRIENTAANGAVQWSFFNCLAAQNGDEGFLVASVSGPAAVALGEVVNCSTFGNSGTGFTALGLPGTPINGVRITGGFFGQDGNHELYLDTYGGEHKIVGLFTELAGTGTTGKTLSTAASHVGAGFAFSANNTDVQCDGCYAEGHSQSGFFTLASEVTLTGCKAISNGQAAITNDQNGFNIVAGRAMLSGVRAGNLNGNTLQLIGIRITDGSTGHLVCGADLTGNTTPVAVVANFTNTTLVGTVPGGNIVIPVGGVQIGPATGGAVSSGAINVSASVNLNNVPYTNP